MKQFYERKNPHRLFRDRENAMLAVVTHSMELAELFDKRLHLEDGCLE